MVLYNYRGEQKKGRKKMKIIVNKDEICSLEKVHNVRVIESGTGKNKKRMIKIEYLQGENNYLHTDDIEDTREIFQKIIKILKEE